MTAGVGLESMAEIERLGKDPLTNRDLYFLSATDLDEIPGRMNFSSPNFICLIAWDSDRSSVEEISSLVEPLIKNGGSYFCAWGNDCERVHDIIDEIDSYPYNDIGSPDDSVIMTTWHSDESLEETLYFF